MTLNYQPGKANVVGDALSQKSYCNTLLVDKAHPALIGEFARLNLEIVPSGYLANLEITSTLEDDIKAAQQQDEDILTIKKDLADGRAKSFRMDDSGVMYFGDRLVVPKSGNVKEFILKEAHESPISIHPVVPRCIMTFVANSGGPA